MPLLLTAKPIIEERKKTLKARIEKMSHSPVLFVFTNPTDEAGQIYVKNKIKFGEEIGVKVIPCEVHSANDVKRVIEKGCCPFIIQKPSLIDEEDIKNILLIYGTEDMDYLSAEFYGRMAHHQVNRNGNMACTPKGIITLLEYYYLIDQINTVSILGRSKIVGKPLEILLRDYYNKTVVVLHSNTKKKDMEYFMKGSDLIVSAIGEPISGCGYQLVPKGKILIDVGIHRDYNNKLRGDFDTIDYINSKAYTPVPGGVGPMTVLSLFENVVTYYEKILIK